MPQPGPEPGTILNESGVPTTPRQAATVLVVRGGADRLEVLMAQRTPKARFMGGAWVFPGGAVDGDEDHRAAALREVEEEVGITLADADAEELLMVFPTIKTLEQIARFDSADALVAWASTHEVKPVQPRVEGE